MDLDQNQQVFIEKNLSLDEVNRALKTLLDQHEVEKQSIEQSMVTRVKRCVYPYLDLLEQMKIGEDAKMYVSIVRSNIDQLSSAKSSDLQGEYAKLTPAEVKIASLVRQGSSTKEIASNLNVSIRTVENHRNNIRKKVGIIHRKVSLFTHLNALV